MTYYLVRLQHHKIEEEFGTFGCDDPYDHYIGDTHTRTNLRFVIVNECELESIREDFIPDDPFNYESVDIIYEFYRNYELNRFLNCMKNITFTVGENETL